MRRRVRVKSPANLAFIKYWGRRDDELILPLNTSISMNLSSCYTVTQLEVREDLEEDEIWVKFYGEEKKKLAGKQLERVFRQIERLRQKYGFEFKVKMESENNFPADAGIASSASGFSALTVAMMELMGVRLSERELSIETRLSGSGSACRSIPDGIVKWERGEGEDGGDSFAYSLYSVDYWELWDLVVVVSREKKKVGSAEGHRLAKNEYMEARLKRIEERVREVERALEEKDLERLGRVIENDALSLHAVAMLSEPPLFYLNHKTWRVIDWLQNQRERGLGGYFTMDAGPNVHIVCERRDKDELVAGLKEVEGVEEVIINKVTEGSRVVEVE